MSNLADCNDVSTFGPDGRPGLQPGKRIRGVRCVLEWVARRWLSRKGALVWDDNTRIDLADYENGDPTRSAVAGIGRILESEARLVPFVKACAAAVNIDAAGNLRASGAITVESAGTYPLIVSASQGKIALSFPTVRQ